MNRNTVANIAKTLSVGVGLVGIVVMVGWIGGFETLKGAVAGYISMKFIAAFAFFLTGIKLYYIVDSAEGNQEVSQVVLPVTTLTVFLLMSILLSSALTGVHSGLEDLFVREAAGAAQTSFPGSPAMPTMIDFVVIAFASISTLVQWSQTRRVLFWVGVVIGISGLLPIVGYLFRIPPLYYTGFAGITNPIALSTSILFLLCGNILVLASTIVRVPKTA